MNCDRCGRTIKYPMIIFKRTSVGFMNSIFKVGLDEYHICPRCAESFSRWLWNKKIKDN